MPLVGLAVLVLWFGWFGFNAGSTLGAIGGRFADVVVVTQLGAAMGVLGALLTSYLITRKFDMGMTANGAIAAWSRSRRRRATWSSGPRRSSASRPAIVVGAMIAIDRSSTTLSAHCRRTASPASGARSPAGCHSPRLAELNAIGDGGLFYTGSFHQLGVQALGVAAAFTAVFTVSFGVFWAIKKAYGLRVGPRGALRPRHRRARHGATRGVHAGARVEYRPRCRRAGHRASRRRSVRWRRQSRREHDEEDAIIRHEKLQEVQDALDQLGVSGLTVSEVVGCGRQKGYTEQYRGVRANISLLPKIKVESVVPADLVDDRVEPSWPPPGRATSAMAACSSTPSSSRSASAPASSARTACATRSPWAGGTERRRVRDSVPQARERDVEMGGVGWPSRVSRTARDPG